jgi:hypothetical protein
MTKGVTEMIDEIMQLLREQGVAVPTGIKQRVVDRFMQMNGGTEVYVPKAPKRVIINRVQQYGTTVPATFIARELGVTVQHVRRVRRLIRG